jgi:hypothetical protein
VGEGGGLRGRGGGGGEGEVGGQQLSALHIISQIIKDDYRILFLEIIILWGRWSDRNTRLFVGNRCPGLLTERGKEYNFLRDVRIDIDVK